MCLLEEKAQARQFDRFILFDRIKWVWWVRNGSSQIKLYGKKAYDRLDEKKGMESNKYNWIPKKIDDYNTNQIRFFPFCTPPVLTRLNHDTSMA